MTFVDLLTIGLIMTIYAEIIAPKAKSVWDQVCVLILRGCSVYFCIAAVIEVM